MLQNFLTIHAVDYPVSMAVHLEGVCYETTHTEPIDFALSLPQLFQALATPIKMIEQVVILTGPGAFTAIRASFAFALGICCAHGCSLLGVNAFELLDFKYGRHQENILYLLQSKRQQYFACQKHEDFSKPYLMQEEDILNHLETAQGIVLANDAAIISENISGKYNTRIHIQTTHARDIVDYVLQNSDMLDKNPEPFYVRPPDVTLPKDRTRT